MAKDIQNGELRFMAMVNVHHAQKQRASSTSSITKYSNLTLLANQTGVVGAVVVLVHQTGSADATEPRRNVIRKNIADISMADRVTGRRHGN